VDIITNANTFPASDILCRKLLAVLKFLVEDTARPKYLMFAHQRPFSQRLRSSTRRLAWSGRKGLLAHLGRLRPRNLGSAGHRW
jgi:hypothetical protein